MKKLSHYKIHRKAVMAILAAGSILLISLFIAINQANFPRKGASDTPVQATKPDQAITTPSEAGDAKQMDKAPEQENPIPETPEIETRDENGNIIVEHPLPNDTDQPPAVMYTAHFARWEFACDHNACGGFPVEMDPVLLEKLEALRNALGRPVIITSGVRCEARNAEVGGIAGSRHLSGKAADLYCPGIHYSEVAQVARAQGLWVLEYPEEKYCHVEV